MRHSLKLLAICFAFCFTALILFACGPSIDATSLDNLTQEQTTDSSNDAVNQTDGTEISTPEPIITDEPITEEQPDTPIHNEIPTPEPVIPNEPSIEEQPETTVIADEPSEIPTDHEHTYSAWKTTKTATCTESGEETGICDCGVQTTRITEPHHQYKLDKTFTATCTDGGYEIYRCSICGTENMKI